MNELPITVSLTDDKKLYEQVYERIREEIRLRNLKEGEKLPSARKLAEDLQISRTTVDVAYGQLEAEGYIEARPRSGFYVAAPEEFFDTEESSYSSQGNEPVSKAIPKEWLYDFSPFGLDLGEFPYASWKKINRRLLSEDGSRFLKAGDPQGDLELRETICRYLHGSRGVSVRPEQIIVGAGNDYLLLLLEKLLDGEKRIAFEDPSYVRAQKIFHSFGYETVPIPVDESGMKTEELASSGAQLAYVMPAHQYPLGIVMPLRRRTELLQWAQSKPERFLIEDDYDSEFRYHGKPIPALMGLDRSGSVIYLGTFSKTLSPSIRFSFMCLPEKLLKRYRERLYFYSSTVSRIDQAALTEFLRDGYFERYLNKMRKIYRRRHDLVLELLEPLRGEYEISGENAGLHLVLTGKNGRSARETIQKAETAGVKLYFCKEEDQYENAGAFDCSVILGYGGMKETELEAGIKLLADVLL